MNVRETIARVCNCILALAKHHVFINDTIIVYAVEHSQSYSVKELLKADVMAEIVMQAKAQLASSQ